MMVHTHAKWANGRRAWHTDFQEKRPIDDLGNLSGKRITMYWAMRCKLILDDRD